MIDVLLVDDHAVVREGYRRLLELQSDMRVVGEAGDGEDAQRLWRTLRPAVLVVDLALPGLGGIELITRLRQRDPDSRCLAFSMYRDEVWVLQALRAGALGYVTKSSPPGELVRAVREVHAGRRVLSADLDPVHDDDRADETGPHGLSPREFEVLRGLVGGRSVREIAEQLCLSVKTVHNIHYQIKAKLQTTSDFDLARLAWRRGWLAA